MTMERLLKTGRRSTEFLPFKTRSGSPVPAPRECPMKSTWCQGTTHVKPSKLLQHEIDSHSDDDNDDMISDDEFKHDSDAK